MIPIIHDIAARLAKEEAVNRVILFGSRARGDASPRSDIDLAVECDGASDVVWQGVRDEVEKSRTLLFIDLVRLDHASAALREQVFQNGVVLYER